MRFAFYGRVSTEDQQDPASSKGWQLSRSTSLILPHGGEVVAEYFDIGQSRSLPWKRRPEAARLLDDLKNPARGFDGVVIGEPARAFYGQQFALTFPVFVHYGVQLWVPEVGGVVEPESDAHEMIMSLYGGMSKGERRRIQLRVRSAMASQVAMEGRFLGGRPPYGYQLALAGLHPNPAKAATGQRLRRLVPDPVAAPIVARIFADYLDGHGLYAVAERLTRDGVLSPSAHDPERNPHRSSSHGAWSKAAVRTILMNPRYTGHEVWNRQRRDEVLLDVEDVAAGHQTKMRWNDRADWVWSAKKVHEPLVAAEDFARVQEQIRAGAHRPTHRKPRDEGGAAARLARPYLLRGLLFCGVCGRRMQGNWNHGRAHYRCRFPSEYAAVEGLEHPLALYVREDQVIPAVDEWLGSLFHPDRLDALAAAMDAVQEPDAEVDARREGARYRITECNDRIAKYRALLDSGTDPVLVSGWLAEVQGEKLLAEATLAEVRKGPPEYDAAAIRERLAAIGPIERVQALAGASQADRSELYGDLGLTLTYHHSVRRIDVEARPRWSHRAERSGSRVRQVVSEGGRSPDAHPLLRAELLLSR